MKIAIFVIIPILIALTQNLVANPKDAIPAIITYLLSDDGTLSNKRIIIAEADGSRRPKARVKNKYDIEFGFQNTAGVAKVGCPDKNIWRGYGYFRFNLKGMPKNKISKATLRLYNRYFPWKDEDKQKFKETSIIIDGAENNWDERAMIWRGNPKVTSKITEKKGVDKGWNEIDVTSYMLSLNSDEKVSFQIGLSDNIDAVFISHEGRTDWRPQLVLEFTEKVNQSQEKPIVSTSKLPKGSLWLVHEGNWKEYKGFRDEKGKLHYALQEAMYDALPGDEIVLGPGRHYERVRTWDRSKKPQRGITIRGDGYPRPILDGSGVESFIEDTWSCNSIIQIFRSSDITISNLEIANISAYMKFDRHWSGIWIEANDKQPANNIKISNVYIHHCGNGIHSNHLTGDVNIEKCEFAYNGYYESDGNQHGVYLEGIGTNTVRMSEFHHNGGQGYKDRAKNSVLSGNYIHDNGNYEFDFMQNSDINEPQNALVIGNVFVKSPFAVNYSKIGAVGGGADSSCKQGSKTWPLCKDRHGGVASFINNTFVITTPAPSRVFLQLIDPYKTHKDSITLFNNIFYSLNKDSKNEKLIMLKDDNTTLVNGSHNWISPQVKINAKVKNSLVKTDNNPGFDSKKEGYWLDKNSVNIDAGTINISTKPNLMYIPIASGKQRTIKGVTIDIGAFEYEE